MSAFDVDELWVPITSFPDYEISSLGTVLDMTTDHEIEPYVDDDGDYSVILWEEEAHPVKVHLLVAEAFFMDYEEGVLVYHKNGQKQDNTIRNLSLGVEPKEN